MMNIRLVEIGERKGWDELVAAHPRGSVEQSWEWGELQTSIAGRSAFRVFGVFEDEQLIGGMLVIRQTMGLGKTWLWCPGGPLLPAGREEEAWALLQAACRNWARLHGDVFLRMETRVLKEEETAVRGKEARECYLPEDTLTLDLSLSEEALLAGMSQSSRRNLKKAAGVKVRRGEEKDLKVFYELLSETAVRDGFYIHKEDFYRAFLEDLGEKAVFYVATLEEKMVGGALMVHFGQTATYYFGASASEARKAKVGHAIQWHAIKEAKVAGFKRYDFLGIAPEGDGHHAWAGVTQFKLGFGGNRVSYQKAQVFVYRGLWWWVYRIVKKLLA